MDKVIYLDVDGVLAQFQLGCLEALGLEIPPPDSDRWKSWDLVNLVDGQENYKRLLNEHIPHPEFWANLKKFDHADELVRECIECVGPHGKVVFLTQAFGYPGSFEGKVLWLRKHYPKLDFAIVSGSKLTFVSRDPVSILIDDREYPDCEQAALWPAPYNRYGRWATSADVQTVLYG